MLEIPRKLLLLHWSLLVFVTSGTAVCAQSESEAAAAYTQAGNANQAGNFDLADQLCLKGLRSLNGKPSRLTLRLLTLRANANMWKGNFPAAESLAQQAVTLAAKLEGTDSIFYASALLEKALGYNASGKFALATPIAIAAASKLHSPQLTHRNEVPVTYLDALNAEMMSLVGQNRADTDRQTLDVIGKVLQEKGKSNPTQFDLHMALASTSSQAGDLLKRAGKEKEAQALYERSLRLYSEWSSKANGPVVGAVYTHAPYPSILSAMKNLSVIYVKSGRTADARKLEKELSDWQNILKTR